MVAKFGSRIKQTTETNGTGAVELSAAPEGFRSFADRWPAGASEISYLIVDDPENPSDFEYGKSTFAPGNPGTLARDTVEGGSNGTEKVSFLDGTKTVIASPTEADFAAIFRTGSWALKAATVRSITDDDTQVAGDDGRTIAGDGSGNSPAGLTFALLAAATAGNGFVQLLKNSGASGDMTIDGNGAETIDGETTLVLEPDESAVIVCDGTEWHAVVKPGGGAAEDITYDNASSGLAATDVQAAVDEVAARATITEGAAAELSPYAINTSVTQAHGLGARPTFHVLELECLSADKGYSDGDIIDLGNSLAYDGGSNSAAAIYSDGTNTTLRTANNSAPVVVPKGGGATTVITAANWMMRVRPFLVS